MELGNFPEQHLGVNHGAAGDKALRVGIENARRDQVQLKRLAIDHHRMTGVDATLVAHHHVGIFAQEVGNFTLALVAPLGTNYNYICQE